MEEKYLIGIDVGTSCTKCVLFDTKGNSLFSCTEQYPLYQPKNGYAEQNPQDWWIATKKALIKITAQTDSTKIIGIGLSGQMHSLVILDEHNEVIRPAILWCDVRTSEECKDIERIIGSEKLIDITANPALPGFTASKLMWVKKHEPENFKKIRHILLAKDYIRLKLTGEYATDVSDASGMQLLDVKNRCWSDYVCQKLGICTSFLANVYESCEISGKITSLAAAETGLCEGTIVAAGGGDNACAAIGTGVCTDGKAFTTIGTSGVVFAHTSKPVIDSKGRIHTFCAAIPGEWHVMGVTQSAGLSLNWFRSNLANEKTYSEIDKECKAIPIGSDSLIYLPYLMGERTPILDANARGVFFGLSALHTKMHMARSVIEGVSFSLYNCLEVLAECGIETDDMALCGGGAKSLFWHKMLADVYGKNIKTMKSGEGASLGAAILAGVAGGIYASVNDGCEKAIRQNNTILYDGTNHRQYMKYYEIYKSIYPASREMFEKLQSLT